MKKKPHKSPHIKKTKPKADGKQKPENLNTQMRKKAVLQALRATLGVVTRACEMTGVDRTVYYDWLRSDKEFAKEVAELKNLALDFVESKLHVLIDGAQYQRWDARNNTIVNVKDKPDNASIFFYLKCQGKARGWIEKPEDMGKPQDQPVRYLPPVIKKQK